MIITKLKISDIKLGTLMIESGAPVSRCAAFFGVNKDTLRSYIEAYKSGKVIISHDDIKKAADGETIKSAHIKLQTIGFSQSERYLSQWCKDHGVKYLSMCRREWIISDKKEQEIVKMLLDGNKQAVVAEQCGVSDASVFKVAKKHKIKNKRIKELSKETLAVIEFLFEAANPNTKKEIVKALGLSKLKVRSAMQAIINHPADYELIKQKTGKELAYKLSAVSSKRKSKEVNDKKKRVIQMLNKGHDSDFVAVALKCKVDTVGNIKVANSGREKIRKPTIDPMMAMVLGMKVK